MISDSYAQTDSQHEFSLKEVLDVLLARKWAILVVTVLMGAAGVAVATYLPKKYQAIIVISPVSSSSNGGQAAGALGSLASQFGGLASLAGITASGDSKKTESIAVLQSEALTERYIRENNLLPILFSKQWDTGNSRWKTDDEKNKPTLWKGNQLFKKSVRLIASDLKSGLVTMTITWTDPATAAKWANGLVDLTNSYLRDKEIAESERNIAYLNSEAAKTTIVEARLAIFSILQNELNKVMLARGNEEFAFKIIDPAVAPEKHSSPLRTNWLIGGLILGLFLSSAVILTRWSWKNA